MKKLLLFDIDGTLITRCLLHEKSFLVSFKKILNIDLGENEIVKHYGKTDKGIIIEIMKANGMSDKEIPMKLNEIYDSMTKYVEDRIESDNSFHLIPNVKNLLVELEKGGHILGILTGNLEKIAKLKLKKLDLLNFFKIGAFGSSSEVRSKLVLMAIKDAEEKFKINFHKKNVFVIGDTYRDVEAGKEAGVKTIAVATYSNSFDVLKKHKPDFIFKDFSDINPIIKAIEST